MEIEILVVFSQINVCQVHKLCIFPGVVYCLYWNVFSHEDTSSDTRGQLFGTRRRNHEPNQDQREFTS